MSETQHQKVDEVIEKVSNELNKKPFEVDESKGAKKAIEESNADARRYAKELLQKTIHELFN